MLGLIIGVFIGSFITIIIMSLMYMAKDYDPKKREPEQKEPECKEPTIMWAKGNLCKWGGKICEITDFSTRVNNDTIALIEWENNGHNYKVWLPIEELEAVEE